MIHYSTKTVIYLFMMNKKWFSFYNIYLIQVKINEHFQKLIILKELIQS